MSFIGDSARLPGDVPMFHLILQINVHSRSSAVHFSFQAHLSGGADFMPKHWNRNTPE